MTKTINIFKEMTGIVMTPNQAIIFMMVHKMAREACNHKRDNLIDLCGYTRLLDEELNNK